MTSSGLVLDIGPFAETKANCANFCHNLLLSHAMDQCAMQMKQAEQEYEAALVAGDEALAKEKELQVQMCHSSLQLTGHIFESVDDIGT